MTNIWQLNQFKESLKKSESLKIVLSGWSEEEGPIILLSVQEAKALIRIISEIPVVENIDKDGKDIIVTLKNLSN